MDLELVCPCCGEPFVIFFVGEETSFECDCGSFVIIDEHGSVDPVATGCLEEVD